MDRLVTGANMGAPGSYARLLEEVKEKQHKRERRRRRNLQIEPVVWSPPHQHQQHTATDPTAGLGVGSRVLFPVSHSVLMTHWPQRSTQRSTQLPRAHHSRALPQDLQQ